MAPADLLRLLFLVLLEVPAQIVLGEKDCLSALTLNGYDLLFLPWCMPIAQPKTTLWFLWFPHLDSQKWGLILKWGLNCPFFLLSSCHSETKFLIHNKKMSHKRDGIIHLVGLGLASSSSSSSTTSSSSSSSSSCIQKRAWTGTTFVLRLRDFWHAFITIIILILIVISFVPEPFFHTKPNLTPLGSLFAIDLPIDPSVSFSIQCRSSHARTLSSGSRRGLDPLDLALGVDKKRMMIIVLTISLVEEEPNLIHSVTHAVHSIHRVNEQ